MATWHEITRDPEYQELTPEAKSLVKKGFFDRVIAADPEYQTFTEDTQKAIFDDFWQTPDDTGQGYVTSMLGAAGRGFGEMVPGAIEGVGALTGSEGLREFGQDVRGGLEAISPVNPVYAESVPVKLAGVGGQVGSMLATAGAGGLAGKALGGVGAATTGMRAAPLASAFLQGSAEGAREAERYGMTGPEAYLRTLAGGATEAGTELLPFGMAAETALARRLLTGAPRTGTFLGAVGSEAGEEGLGQIASNIATKALAPAGVETPDITEGALEAAAYGAAGGAMIGGVNALISTPPERQTQIQKDRQAEFGDIPKDTVPDQTNEEKIAAMEAGGTTVVDPDGKTAVIPPAVVAKEPPSMISPEIAIAQNAIAATQNVPFTDITGQTAQNIAEENARIASQLAVSTEQKAKEAGVEVAPSPAMEMPSPPQGVDMASASVSPIITEAPIQPVETQEDAAREIPLEESVREEPQDRIESREEKESSIGNILLDSANSQEEEKLIRDRNSSVRGAYSSVFSNINNLKVADSIISNLPVNVVNLFGGKEGASQVLLHNPTVLQDTLTIYGDSNIPMLSGDSRMLAVARLRAKLLSFEPAGRNTKLLTALKALDDNLLKIVRFSTNGGSQLEGQTNIPSSDIGASFGTKAGTFPPVKGDIKSGVANSTSFSNPAMDSDIGHAGIFSYKYPKSSTSSSKKEKSIQPITPQGTPTPATEGMVTPGGVAMERETDEQKFQRIKSMSPSQRTDEDIAFANAFSKRQKELKPQAGEATRKAFLANHTASIGGRLRKALDQTITFRGLRGTVGSWVENLYNEGWRMALDARGNRQFTNGTEALGSSGLGKVGVNYADFLSSQPQTTKAAAETQTPVPLREGTGAAGVASSSLGGGRSPELTQVSTETETTSSEKLDPKLIEAERKQAKEEEAAVKQQEKLDQATKSSLNSVVGPQKKDPVVGTVTKVDVETAREALTNSGEIPNAYLTNVYESREAFLADKANARLFPASYARLQTEKNIEGLYENGQTLIFAKQIQVSDLDRGLAKMLGISDEQAAARRVIAHENGHRAISLFTMAEKRELRGYLMRAYSDEQIAKLVERYTEYADWRTNPESRLEALEELLMRDFERMEKIPTGGVWDDIVQFLKRVWRRLTGQKGEPKLKELKDVVRLMRNAMKRPAVPLGSYTLKDGGQVKLSMIAPTARITPEQDAEYLEAVAAGDMEKAQRMVDEAAKAAGGAEVWHGGNIEGSIIDVNRKERGAVSERRSGTFFASSNKDVARTYPGKTNRMFFFLKNPFRISTPSLRPAQWTGETAVRTAKGIESRKSSLSIGEAIDRAKDNGYDGVVYGNILDLGRNQFGVPFVGDTYVAFSPNQIKSADPVTRDDAGNVIPLSQRFQPTSSDIRFSRPQFASDTSAAFSAGSEAARSTLYSERDMDIREAIRRAYDAIPKTNSVAVPIDELFAKTEELMPGVTQDEFSNVLQDLFEDNGAVLQEGESDFFVTTPEGRRAGFVVVMPRAAKASRIPIEELQEASKPFKEHLVEASKGRDKKAAFQGNMMRGNVVPDHNVNATELYKKAANDLLDSLLKNHDIIDVAASIQDPDLQAELGMQIGGVVQPEDILNVRQYLGALLQRRLTVAISSEKKPKRLRQLELARESINAYSDGASGGGTALNNAKQVQNDPELKGDFFFSQATRKKAQKAKDKLDAITGGTEKITDIITGAEQRASEETTQAEVEAQESAAEDDQDAIDLAAGEATLTEPEKSLYEEYKDILRRRGILDMLDKRDASAAKASISAEERNALTKLTKAERDEMRKRDDKRRMEILARLLGKESPTDTSAQKATRQKREKMVKTAQKRAGDGKEIEVTRIQIQSFMDELMPGYTERESIVNEVGDALLKAAEQRKVKPKQRTAIQDFVSAIKQTLMANIKGDKINAEQPSLGMLLAKTFAQQGSQPEEFAAAWANGRKKVRGMLAEMGVEEGNLDAELDAIMPPTPTLAYAPAAARKAVSNAMREAGLIRSDLLNDPAGSKKAIMEKFDEAAKSANLTEEGWGKKGRALAEKAVDESIAEAKMAQERAKKVAKILSEQADKPVSLEEFGAKLAEFRFKKDKIAELFNRAKKLAERKIQMANDQAVRVLLAAENKLVQSAFFNAAEKPDTIVKAFREQVEEPMERDAFKKRMEKMLVTPEMADKLFDKAARERDNARWKKAQDILEGPKALGNLLREMNKARPADSVPLERAMPWRKILSSKPKDVAEYRQRILEAVSSIESFQNLTEEQKERLADLYAEAWEERRQAILDRMLRDEIKKARDRDEISDDVEKKLQQSRNKILEIINLGGFNNDDLVKILGERYGISTSFTEEQKERIQKLADQLQDEDMNTAKRNKLAMEFAVELAGAMDVPVTEIIANWWTSSVLFGPQTIFSIGAAFLNGGYSITTIGTRRMLAKLFKGDVQGSLEESILMLKGIARYLGAFKQAGRRAWNYLWSGDVGLLGIGSNDILSEISNFEQLQRFQRHKLLAEQLAKDPKRVRRYVGIYLRFVSRLLTALDAFNVMVTKAGTASLALRMSGMSTENIIKAEKMLNLKAYKDQVIRDYFDNKAPKTQAEKALVDSYAEAEMYRAIDKMGGKMENADYLASESAMTMHPTGFGGVIYDAITGFFAQRQANADEYLDKMKKDWVTRKDLTSVTFLALAYLRQFAAYNAAGLTGSKFVRYASNKFNQGLSFIPFAGLLRQLEAKDDRIKGKDAFIETIYRNQVIGALMLFIGGAVLGAIEDEPDDEERGTFWNGGWANLTPDQKKQLLAKGQKEYTMGFKYNGRWYVFNYQNWPLNQMLSAIGSMSDQIRFSPKQWNEKSLLSKTVAGMVSGVKSTLEIPALSGLQELVGNRLASKDPTEQSLDRISRVASGWVGGFVPRILKDIDFATQPELRKYETLWEKTASHIPIYRRYVGEEYYDILGKPIKRNVIPGSREFMMGPTEPEYKILGALNSRNIFLTPANAEYRMVGKGRNRRRLTQEEADAYSLETGKGYRQMLLRYGQRALQMPTERARAFLSDKADEVRDRALKKVYRGYTK